MPLTKEPLFYDRLLEVLALEVVHGENSDHIPDFDEPTPVPVKGRARRVEEVDSSEQRTLEDSEPQETPAQQGSKTRRLEEDRRSEPRSRPSSDRRSGTKERRSDKEARRKVQAKKARKASKRPRAEDSDVIELRPYEALVQKELSRKKLLATVALLLIAGAAWTLFNTGETSRREERVRLLGPGQSETLPLPSDQIHARMQRAQVEFFMDSLPTYVRAMNGFTQIIESDSADNTLAGPLLCLTYLELWPFAYQDRADFRTVTSMVQLSNQRSLSFDFRLCSVVDLILRGRSQEADNLITLLMNQLYEMDEPPVVYYLFYYLRSLIFDQNRDSVAALGYLQTLKSSIPQWLRPHVLSAQIHAKMSQPTEAAQILREVLKQNPRHPVAKVELGALNFQFFRQSEAAQELIMSALKGEVALPAQVASRGHFILAEIALQKNDKSRALDLAQKAYSLHSANSQAKNLILVLGGSEGLRETRLRSQQLIYEGDQFFREGDCHSAQAHYQAAFELDPSQALAAVKAAHCMWTQGFSKEAMDWLNKGIRADPSYVEAYAVLADYYSQRFDFIAAARTLAAGQRAAPRAYEILRGYALLELRRGNPQVAVHQAQRALQLFDQDVETLIILAEAYINLGDFNSAHAQAVRATELDPNHRGAQIVYAKSLVGLQGPRSGIAHLSELVQLYPQVSDYGIGLGQILINEQMYEEASQLFERIHAMDSSSKEILLWWGRALRGERKFNQALDVFLRAAVMDPGDAEALFDVGEMYHQLGRYAEAATQFERVLQVNPSYPRAHYSLGRTALMSGNLRLALEQAEAEKRQNPNIADAYLLAAEVQAARRQYSLCAQEYQQAIRLRPQSAIIYVRLAQCYRLGGSLDVAISMLRQAANQESGLPDIYREQGEVYLMQGDLLRAHEAFEQYFVLNPNAPDRDQIQQRIQALQGG